ncbi:hypothetical protein C3B58_04605, partial [Lactonifactor longoviformis]|uniref:hypothetical protein n=1 Tax=Lactonifactor longoviformis TaxID=341220 RepID=UPI000D43232F
PLPQDSSHRPLTPHTFRLGSIKLMKSNPNFILFDNSTPIFYVKDISSLSVNMSTLKPSYTK